MEVWYEGRNSEICRSFTQNVHANTDADSVGLGIEFNAFNEKKLSGGCIPYKSRTLGIKIPENQLHFYIFESADDRRNSTVH
jgi:hypothetical protein